MGRMTSHIYIYINKMEIIKWKIRFIFETTNQLCIFPIFLGVSPPVRVLDQLGGRAEGAGEALVDVLVAPAAHCFDLSFRRPREIKRSRDFFFGNFTD